MDKQFIKEKRIILVKEAQKGENKAQKRTSQNRCSLIFFPLIFKSQLRFSFFFSLKDENPFLDKRMFLAFGYTDSNPKNWGWAVDQITGELEIVS